MNRARFIGALEVTVRCWVPKSLGRIEAGDCWPHLGSRKAAPVEGQGGSHGAWINMAAVKAGLDRQK